MEISPLLGRIKQRDESALAVLYAQFATPVYSICLRVLRNPKLAQEAAQDTFLKVWQNPQAWNPAKGQFSSWLLTTARYTAIDRLRQEVRRTSKDVDLDDEVLADEDSQEFSPVEAQQVRDLLHQLPDEQRQVVQLAYFNGLKHSELAEHLHLPLGTVKTRLRLGLQKLKGLWINKTE